MSSKEKTHNGEKTSSKKQVQKTTTENALDTLVQQQPQLPTLIQRAELDPRSLPPRDVLQLQRAIGNQRITRLIQAHTIRRSPIPATSLTSAQTKAAGDDILASTAKDLGYQGDSTDAATLRKYIKVNMGFDTDAELDEFLEERAKPQSLYQKRILDPKNKEDRLLADRLKNLNIPSTLEHEHLEQSAQGGACQAVAAIAGQQLQNVGSLQAVLQSQTPTTAFFKFPSAGALEPYIAHSSQENQDTIHKIIETQNNVYSVQKELHTGDLLPSTEPWANLLLKALHQYLTQLGYGNPDSFEVYIPLQVRKEAASPVKDIVFNVLTAAIGEGKPAKEVAQFKDEELKGKKLQIGHKGHATTLVVRDDGSKIYYDNQLGVEKVFTTVQEFLERKGMNGPETSIIIE